MLSAFGPYHLLKRPLPASHQPPKPVRLARPAERGDADETPHMGCSPPSTFSGCDGPPPDSLLQNSTAPVLKL